MTGALERLLAKVDRTGDCCRKEIKRRYNAKKAGE